MSQVSLLIPQDYRPGPADCPTGIDDQGFVASQQSASMAFRSCCWVSSYLCEVPLGLLYMFRAGTTRLGPLSSEWCSLLWLPLLLTSQSGSPPAVDLIQVSGQPSRHPTTFQVWFLFSGKLHFAQSLANTPPGVLLSESMELVTWSCWEELQLNVLLVYSTPFRMCGALEGCNTP